MNLDLLHTASTEVTSLVSGAASIWPDLSADDGTGLLMPALTGVVAAVTVALALAIYFQTGYRSYRDMIRHGLAAAIGLALMAFVIYDMRNAAMAYLVKAADRPAAEFEHRWQQSSEGAAQPIAAEIDRRLPEARKG